MKPNHNSYQSLSARTNAPLGPVRERLKSYPALVALLYYKLRELQHLGKELDLLKSVMFYGNPETGGSMTLPIPQYDNAQEAFKIDGCLHMLHAVLGLASEAGEIAIDLEHYVFFGDELDSTNLLLEGGDIQWFAARMADGLGTTIEQLQEMNIAKLKARFPEGFTQDKALNRDTTEERKAAEPSESVERSGGNT